MTVNLQTKADKQLVEDAREKARAEGYGELQNLIRLFLTKYAKGEVEL